MAAGEPVHRFVHRAIAAADDNELTRSFNGSAGKARGFPGSGRLLQFRFNSRVAKNVPRLVQLRRAASATRVGIDDQHCISNFRIHLVCSVFLQDRI